MNQDPRPALFKLPEQTTFSKPFNKLQFQLTTPTKLKKSKKSTRNESYRIVSHEVRHLGRNVELPLASCQIHLHSLHIELCCGPLLRQKIDRHRVLSSAKKFQKETEKTRLQVYRTKNHIERTAEAVRTSFCSSRASSTEEHSKASVTFTKTTV